MLLDRDASRVIGTSLGFAPIFPYLTWTSGVWNFLILKWSLIVPESY